MNQAIHAGQPGRGPTYRELIRRGAAQHGERIAVEFGEQQMSFREVDELSSRIAHALLDIAAQRTRIGILLNNSLLSVPMDFGTVKAGMNRVPLNARLSLHEHRRMLEDTGCRHLFFGQDLAERASALQKEMPELNCFGVGVTLDNAPDLLELARHRDVLAPDITILPDDVVLTLFTSGTTGTLKAAMHTHASYAAICRNVLLNLLPATQDDAMLHAASLIHASGVFVLPLWLRGGRTVILPGFEPAQFLQAIADHRVTAINLVPTMIQMLLDDPHVTRADVASLKYVIYGASPMPRPVIERAMALWGQHRFWQYYGQTEVPLCLAVLRPEHHTEATLDACGQPAVDVEIRLVDEAGNDVPAGTPGEITVRAPSAVAGYHDAAALTGETFVGDGWVRTRDIGVFDEKGFLRLKDRTSDMVISGGYNVYPSEVENVLMTHPSVLECAVIGLPDPKWVEIVAAVVVLRNEQCVSEQALIDHVAQRLASYKRPRRIFFADSIPKTAVGKLNRKAVRTRYRSA
ncbi:class I adenylate-forming enzyme family protein [Burkholderia guangdongensis]|uniref:class I adenylate-forming enzyme family protein n=1 Tax=Burkholderia guangdongensis TaxID=1792500 RepID=UPI0015CAA898|nr:AMP-binding protein [Burkholderia guangdongensis]